MKKPIFTLVMIMLALSTVGGLSTSTAQATTDFARYTVIASSNSTNAWFNADYSQSFNYHIEENTNIEVNFIRNDSDNVQFIDISVGNLTRADIRDDEAAENLVLNYWELKGNLGFLANTSWSDLFYDLERINFDNLDISEENLSYLGRSLETVGFAFETGGQNTTLIYEKRSGLLLEAITGFGAYQLSIVIDDTDMIPFYDLVSTSDNLPIIMMAFVTSLAFLMAIKISTKKRALH